MHQNHRGRRVRQTKLPVELPALGLIALMWVAILIGTAAAAKIDKQQELTPQPTLDIIEQPRLVEFHLKEPTAMVTEILEPEIVEEEIKRTYYDCPMDQGLQDYIYDRMEQFGINLDLAWPLAMVWNESRFDQYAYGAAKDSGYFQIIPSTFQYVYPKVMAEYPELNLVNDVFDSHTNIACALYYMKMIADGDELGEVNEENIHHILTCYNRGPGGGWRFYNTYGTWVCDYSQRISDIKDIIIAEGTTANIHM